MGQQVVPDPQPKCSNTVAATPCLSDAEAKNLAATNIELKADLSEPKSETLDKVSPIADGTLEDAKPASALPSTPVTASAPERQGGPAGEDPQVDFSSEGRFHWGSAFRESGLFLAIQHGFRLFQKRTTNELGGPFFRDWGRSVKGLRGWSDGDSFLINYVAHPLQGGVTGRIFINNSDRAKRLEFGTSKEYWKSRMKAMAWSAAWSTQFELGPVSEASIGNVGLKKVDGKTRMGFVDLVMTPTAGTGVVIAEDAVDKYVLKNWIERKFGSESILTKIFRSVLTPTTTFSNLLRGKVPWKRNDR
ncbi:MAG: hypothetical protein LC113_12640 [Acidobacteria bacterium]|nr:hypothetical protein [Acidobacteriota bacterium]